ncbi:MAG: hypothetical protein KAX79_00105 [Aeromonas sp.]|uniref:hypothetical protein n=1 Tax=Aeromonas media TaxID=651 RepID=UPI001B645422|nr:hypothetical protein [Aeromonas sp.]
MFALLVPMVVACGIVKDYRPQAVPALDAVCTMGRVPLGRCMPAAEEHRAMHRPAAEGAEQAVEISWRLACFVGNGSNPIKTGGIASRFLSRFSFALE